MAGVPNNFVFNSDFVFLKVSRAKHYLNFPKIQIVTVKFLPTLLSIDHI